MPKRKSPLESMLSRNPVQDRSRAALLRIYEATNALLAHRSFDDIPVTDIAEAADVAVGSIYQRFDSKDALLWAMYGAYLERSTARIALLWQVRDGDARQRALAVIRLIAELFSDNRGVVRSLLLRYRRATAQVPERYVENIEVGTVDLVNYLKGDDCVFADAEFAMWLILAVSREHYLFGHFKGGDDPAFEERLLEAVLSALASRSPA